MAVTDSFTGTDGTVLTTYSANWTLMQGTGTLMTIQSNALRIATGATADVAAKYAGSFPATHSAQVTVAAYGQCYVGAAVRCGTSGNYYGYYRDCGGSATDIGQTFKMIAGVWTQLGSDGAQRAIVVNDIIAMAASGTTLTPNENGSTTNTPGAQTDSGLSTGSPGICFYSDGFGTGPSIDDFSATDPAGVVASALYNRRARRILRN